MLSVSREKKKSYRLLSSIHESLERGECRTECFLALRDVFNALNFKTILFASLTQYVMMSSSFFLIDPTLLLPSIKEAFIIPYLIFGQ